MARPIAVQKMIEAVIDAESLGVVVNGNDSTDVVTRLGEKYPTIKKSIKLMTQAGIGFTPFETKALMTASSKTDGTYAVVTNDITANLGVYLKKSGAWVLVSWNNLAALNSLTINKGKDFPFKKMTRDGIISNSSNIWNNLILDAKILGASPDKYYQIAYQQNGATLSGKNEYNWIIYEFDKATFSTASVPVRLTDAIDAGQPQLVPDGTTQKIVINATRKEGIKIMLTCDTSALPAANATINSNQDWRDAWSFIVDPTRYEYADSANDAEIETTFSAYVKYAAASKSFSYRYISGAYVYEVVFGTNGANNLPNFKSIGRVLGVDLTVPTIPLIQGFTTDWLPPLVFYVINNPDVGNKKGTFTGGNHASNGDDTGEPTAVNDVYAIFLDDCILDMSKNIECFTNGIKVKIVNRVMASNSKIQKRYAIRQVFDLKFEGASIDVHCKIKAIEDIKMQNDYAIQATTLGFNNSVLMLGAENISRVPFTSSINSGVSSDYPAAWATILKGTGGVLTTWMDRAYGNGKPENVAPNQPLIAGGGAGNTKFYHRAWRSYGSETLLPDLLVTPSYDYKWRGGYVIQHDNATNGYDCVIQANNLTAVIDGAKYH